MFNSDKIIQFESRIQLFNRKTEIMANEDQVMADGKEPRFKIKKWNAVALWSWGITIFLTSI